MLAACGGGGSTAALVAAGLPVNPLSVGKQVCAPGYTGTYPDCVAPPPPPCGTQGTMDQTCTPVPPVTTPPTPPTSTPPSPPVLAACGIGVQNPSTCSCPPTYYDYTHGQCITPNPACPGYDVDPCPNLPPPITTAPTMTLTAAADPAAPGQFILTWTSTNALDCIGTYGSGQAGSPTWPVEPATEPPQGSINTGPLLYPSMLYELVCSGPGGNAYVILEVAPSTTP